MAHPSRDSVRTVDPDEILDPRRSLAPVHSGDVAASVVELVTDLVGLYTREAERDGAHHRELAAFRDHRRARNEDLDRLEAVMCTLPSGSEERRAAFDLWLASLTQPLLGNRPGESAR